jgi:predicted pyridoxine 5'-phosphate oxidase superfamily flavin-nucleotide-binding protein
MSPVKIGGMSPRFLNPVANTAALREIVGEPSARIAGKVRGALDGDAAAIVRDDWLLDQMAIEGLAPRLALVVSLDEVFFHCPKCLVRSELWRHETWPDAARLASFGHVRSSQAPT